MKMTRSDFNIDTGESIVELQDKYGIYQGYAKICPEDREYISRYAGLRIAQHRAQIKYLKSQRRRIKERLKEAVFLRKELENLIDKKAQRRLNLRIRDYHTQLEDINFAIDELKKLIREEIKVREQIIKKIKTAKGEISQT